MERMLLEIVQTHERALREVAPTASPSAIEHALESLPQTLDEQGLGTEGSFDFVHQHLLPGLAPGQPGPRFVCSLPGPFVYSSPPPRYFGFVTGGTLPSALVFVHPLASQTPG